MKYIKLYEKHISEREIIKLCGRWNIRKFTINDDYSIDVIGDVFFGSPIESGELPLKFRNVEGNFYCSSIGLTTLKGCPNNITGYFDCSSNRLTSLEYSPNFIGDDFLFYNNQISSFDYFPNHINGNIICLRNKLTSFKGCPESIEGNFDCRNNNLTSFKYSPRHINGNFSCQGNDLKSTLYFPNDITMGVQLNNTQIPDDIKNLDFNTFFKVIKNQEMYIIWNEDETLNIKRFNILMDDIKNNQID